MKKLIVALSFLLLLLVGLWLLVRRKPTAAPQEDTPIAFKSEPSGSGALLSYQATNLPLRSLRWLPPIHGGIQAAQIITQSNRQQIAWFVRGEFKGVLTLQKPFGVREGFFNFAEIVDACFWPDMAIFLFRSTEQNSDELPLVIALDLNTQEIRWIHRGLGSHLIQTPEAKGGAVYLFDSKTPITRLPLALEKTEQASKTGTRAAAKTIELPSEIQEVGDLLPLGSWTFLVAHKGGLSTYLGIKGWKHTPNPENAPSMFENVAPRLVRAKHLWWQPWPGTLIQLSADGTLKQTWTQEELTTAEPFEKDSALLHLIGSDDSGKLWFDLISPPLPSPTITMQKQETTEDQPTERTQEMPETIPAEGWTTDASQDIERLYCWNPQEKVIKRLSLSQAVTSAQPPTGVQLSPSIRKISPTAGAILFDLGPSSWWLPLGKLPLGDPSIIGKIN